MLNSQQGGSRPLPKAELSDLYDDSFVPWIMNLFSRKWSSYRFHCFSNQLISSREPNHSRSSVFLATPSVFCLCEPYLFGCLVLSFQKKEGNSEIHSDLKQHAVWMFSFKCCYSFPCLMPVTVALVNPANESVPVATAIFNLAPLSPPWFMIFCLSMIYYCVDDSSLFNHNLELVL